MQKLIDHYQIQKKFFSRYFRLNAEMRLIALLRDFMLWRKGHFIFPKDRQKVLDNFTSEEIHNFYEKKILSIPQIQFAITNRCTLKCKDCNFFCTDLNKFIPHDLSVKEFCADLSRLTEISDKINRFIILGGEPLLHRNLPEMLDVACHNEKISAVEIITNGTLLPHTSLLDVAQKYSNKVWFHISDYSANTALHAVLRHSELIAVLKERNIKYQLSANTWHHELPIQPYGQSREKLLAMFDSCWVKRCVQAYDGKVSICPRASAGCAMGLAPYDADVDLRNCQGEHLRQAFIDFYKRESFAACEYCMLATSENITPALQL